MSETEKPKTTRQQQQFQEIIKCSEDPIYFIKKYLYIQHPVRGRLPFNLYEFQEDCIHDFINFKFNVVVKSRQLGLSTVTAAYCLWFALLHRDKNILIMATKLQVGQFMIQKIRTMFQMLPAWMLDQLGLTDPETESVKYITFSNGSRITAIPTSPDAGRGEAVSLLIVDEAAHIDNFEELWIGLKPVLSTGGRAIVFSTPKGKNFFYKIYSEAETGIWQENKLGLHATTTGKNTFHAIKLPWTVHPERDEKWFDNECLSMDARGIAQELLCSFEGSGQTFFNQTQIDYIKNNVAIPQIVTGPNGSGTDLWIWKSPEPSHQYIICADVARGDAEDFSAFHVIDTNTDEISAEYIGKIFTDDYGWFLVEIAKKYNNALIIQEKNTFGVACANAMKLAGYSNFWYEPEIREKMQIMLEEEKLKQIPGFTTNPKNREGMLNKLEEAIRSKKIRIYSSRFGDEMDTFIWNGKRGQALKRKHDDLILALAIGLQIYDPKGNGLINQGNNDMAWHMAFLKGISRSENLMSTQPNSYGVKADNPFLQNLYGSARIPTLTSDSENRFMGKKLPSGVRRENVELDHMFRAEFDWLFK